MARRAPEPLLAALLTATVISGCSRNDQGTQDTGGADHGSATSEATSPYLYVWAGATEDGDSDFLAVVDADPASESYGEVLGSVAVGLRGGAHHSEHRTPPGDSLFVNSFMGGASFVIDVSDPANPVVASSFTSMGDYTYPHTFERLPNGNVLATFQTMGEGNEAPGGLVELGPGGEFVRASPAADPVDPELRAYSATPIPRLDLAVSTTSDMWGEAQGISFQVWRLSDLTLLKTVMLPEGELGYEHRDPAEVRLLPDSVTAIMTTFTCAMYVLHDLESDEPRAELVNVLPWADYETDECGIPVTTGRFWIQTYANSQGQALISMDISDPSRPVELDRLEWEGYWWPHWISVDPTGTRLVVTGMGEIEHRAVIVNLDPETGRLSFDESFRDPETGELGVSFARTSWPHGDVAGPGRPHGAVFSRTR